MESVVHVTGADVEHVVLLSRGQLGLLSPHEENFPIRCHNASRKTWDFEIYYQVYVLEFVVYDIIEVEFALAPLKPVKYLAKFRNSIFVLLPSELQHV